MFKMFMNEPYATRHELAQARRLVDLLSREFSASDVHVWLCLNFSFGGKSIDGALITPEKFAILEFKAVGGDVDCGASLENSQWVWRDYPMMTDMSLRHRHMQIHSVRPKTTELQLLVDLNKDSAVFYEAPLS